MPIPTRRTLESLITLEAHNCQAIDQLIGANVNAVNSEEWTKYMRYYSDNGIVFVKVGTTFVEYQNEFLGSHQNLVVTPQTLRMYDTIERAKFGKKFTVLAGPAGVGKTETLKDFANGIGVGTFVVNCSDTLDHKVLEKLVKGATTGGFWLIFDEFNRIAVEVLDAFAHFLTTLYQAKESGQTTFEEDATPIDVHSEIGFTMNPGYAGRTEMPAMFDSIVERTVVERPDYERICEVMLYHMGLVTSSTLASKMIAAFQAFDTQHSK
jgi:dynein heavy chain